MRFQDFIFIGYFRIIDKGSHLVSLSQSTEAMFFCVPLFYFTSHATVSEYFTVSVLEFLICAVETTADNNKLLLSTCN
jgi:hypothetical protein